MKKLSFCALALTLTALFFSGSALAGDVPSCRMIGWDDAAAAQQWDWKGASGCGVTNGVTEWDSASCGTTAWDNASCGTAAWDSASCGTTAWDSASCGTAAWDSASCGTAASETTQTQSAGTQEPIRCGSCGSTSCDGYCTGTASGNSSCWRQWDNAFDDGNCIYYFGAQDDCGASCPQQGQPEQSEQDYTAQSVSPQEIALYNMINEDREKNGVSALPLDEELSAIARLKSEDMIENNYFDHESPTYGRAAEMLEDFYYEFTSVGENIARSGSLEKAHAALMSSAGHVRNLLGSQWKAIGIGVANDENGYPYVTELFVR